jgi:hypothetical protein
MIVTVLVTAESVDSYIRGVAAAGAAGLPDYVPAVLLRPWGLGDQ